MKIEAGKFYQSRGGAVFGPMVASCGVWEASNKTWFFKGHYINTTTASDLDLIRPVSIYPEQPYEYGEEIEVSDISAKWTRNKFIALSPSKNVIVIDRENGLSLHRYHRPIPKKPTRDQVLDAVKKCRKAHDNDMMTISGKTIDAMIELLEGGE